MKIAVVVDSNSGVTQKEAKELGLFVLPMPFMIDGEEYFEGITLTHEEFYRRLAADSEISTSQPAPGAVTALWDQLLEEYDGIVHIPMSSALSSSCQTARLLAEDYEGRVQVADNRRIATTQRQSALDALALARKGLDAAAIRERLEQTGGDSSIYLTVDTLRYLKKGGRITPAAAALGTLLRLKPVLTIQGGKLDAFGRARTMKQAKSMMSSAVARDMETRWNDTTGAGTNLQIVYSCSEELAEELAAELEQQFPQVSAPIFKAPVPMSIACHTGPGVLAITAAKITDLG